MSNGFVRLVRATLPQWLYQAIRTYYVRILVWIKVARHIRGVSGRDALLLFLSIAVAPFTSLRSLDGWQDPLLLADIVVRVRGAGTFALRARTDDLWHVTPERELALLRYLKQTLRPDDCFVDAGANIGFYTVTAAGLVGVGGSVIAIEMMEANARALRENIARNGSTCVKVVEKALSDAEGNEIIASMPRGSFGQASIRGADSDHKFSVRTTTLDSILANTKWVRLLKIDIEGAEYDALKGAAEALDRIEAIVFEYLDPSSFEQISDLLRSHGFEIDRLDSTNGVARRRTIANIGR